MARLSRAKARNNMRDRTKLEEQELGHTIWTIVKLFYRSFTVFQELFSSYERKVLAYSETVGIPRELLRLKPAELGGLLDYKRLEDLRDGFIHELKDLCHLVFRGNNSTDLLDRYVSDIFHEISILKEEHYSVIVYAPLWERDHNEVELKLILDEAHELFPLKLRQIHYLYERAKSRLEAQLASFAGYRLFIRSLYLEREGFVASAYPDGIDQFYRFMYPGGVVEGYTEVARSFLHSSFLVEAAQALREVELARSREARISCPSPEATVRIEECLRFARQALEHLELRDSEAVVDPELKRRNKVQKKPSDGALLTERRSTLGANASPKGSV